MNERPNRSTAWSATRKEVWDCCKLLASGQGVGIPALPTARDLESAITVELVGSPIQPQVVADRLARNIRGLVNTAAATGAALGLAATRPDDPARQALQDSLHRHAAGAVAALSPRTAETMPPIPATWAPLPSGSLLIQAFSHFTEQAPERSSWALAWSLYWLDRSESERPGNKAFVQGVGVKNAVATLSVFERKIPDKNWPSGFWLFEHPTMALAIVAPDVLEAMNEAWELAQDGGTPLRRTLLWNLETKGRSEGKSLGAAAYAVLRLSRENVRFDPSCLLIGQTERVNGKVILTPAAHEKEKLESAMKEGRFRRAGLARGEGGDPWPEVLRDGEFGNFHPLRVKSFAEAEGISRFASVGLAQMLDFLDAQENALQLPDPLFEPQIVRVPEDDRPRPSERRLQTYAEFLHWESEGEKISIDDLAQEFRKSESGTVHIVWGAPKSGLTTLGRRIAKNLLKASLMCLSEQGLTEPLIPLFLTTSQLAKWWDPAKASSSERALALLLRSMKESVKKGPCPELTDSLGESKVLLILDGSGRPGLTSSTPAIEEILKELTSTGWRLLPLVPPATPFLGTPVSLKRFQLRPLPEIDPNDARYPKALSQSAALAHLARVPGFRQKLLANLQADSRTLREQFRRERDSRLGPLVQLLEELGWPWDEPSGNGLFQVWTEEGLTSVEDKHGRPGERSPLRKDLLLDAVVARWDQPRRHVLLIGDGGAGKTTALLALVEQLSWARGPAPHPVFIRLEGYNTVPKNPGEFLGREVSRALFGRDDADSTDQLRTILNRPLLDGNRPIPALLLLLDGYNEVTVDRSDLNKAIQDFARYAGVQIIVTSRSGFHLPEPMNPHPLRLLEPTFDEIAAFCSVRGVQLDPGQLRDPDSFLRNPFLLNLFCGSAKEVKGAGGQHAPFGGQYEFLNAARAKGEVLWNYVEASLFRLDHLQNASAGEAALNRLFLKRVIPEIGYWLECGGQFGARLDDLKHFIKETLSRLAAWVDSEDEYQFQLEGLADWEQLLTADDKAAIKTIKRLAEILGLLHRNADGSYEFRHHYLRDFFSALHIRNQMECAKTSNALGVLRERVLPLEVAGLLADVAGGRQMKGGLLDEKLDLLRDFDDPKDDQAVWNLVRIFRDFREDLRETDLSGLDLRGINLYGSLLGKPTENPSRRPCRLKGSRIDEHVFLPTGHTDSIESVVASPDGRFIYSGSWDKTIRKWDPTSGLLLLIFEGHSRPVTTVAISPDGGFIYTGSRDNTVRKWDAITGLFLLEFKGHSNSVTSVAVSPDGRCLYSGSKDGHVLKWDAVTGRLLLTIRRHIGGIEWVAVSPDGTFLYTGGAADRARKWDTITGRLQHVFDRRSTRVGSVAMSPDGRFLFGSKDKTVLKWDANTGQHLLTFEGLSSWVRSVAVSPDGRFIYSGSKDKTVQKWDASTGQLLLAFEGHSSRIRSVAVSPDGRFIYSGSVDGTVQRWNAGNGHVLLRFGGHYDWVVSVAVSPDGRFLYSGGRDKTIRKWSANTGHLLLTFEGHSGVVRSVAVSADGRFLYSGGMDTTVRKWDASTGHLLLTFEGHSLLVASVATSSDRCFLYSGSMDKTVRKWDANTGHLLLTFEGHSGGVRSVAVSADGRFLYSGSMDTTVRQWDANTGQLLLTFEGHSLPVESVAAGSDGRFIYSGSLDKTVRQWDAYTGQPLLTFEGHSLQVESVAVSPGGRFLYSGSGDYTVRKWDTNTGQLLLTFEGHSNRVESVTVSPDGLSIYSGSHDSTVRKWHRVTGEPVWAIRVFSGLWVWGLDLRDVHSASSFSEQAREVLLRYGALLPETARTVSEDK